MQRTGGDEQQQGAECNPQPQIFHLGPQIVCGLSGQAQRNMDRGGVLKPQVHIAGLTGRKVEAEEWVSPEFKPCIHGHRVACSLGLPLPHGVHLEQGHLVEQRNGQFNQPLLALVTIALEAQVQP